MSTYQHVSLTHVYSVWIVPIFILLLSRSYLHLLTTHYTNHSVATGTPAYPHLSADQSGLRVDP